MLAVVKEPHIELSLNGSETDLNAFVNALRRDYDITIVVNVSAETATRQPPAGDDDDEGSVDIRDTDFWREMGTPGHLLAGARLKHGMTQEQLAEKSGIHHVTISAYENGRRKVSRRAAIRLARALGEDEATFYDKLTK